MKKPLILVVLLVLVCIESNASVSEIEMKLKKLVSVICPDHCHEVLVTKTTEIASADIASNLGFSNIPATPENIYTASIITAPFAKPSDLKHIKKSLISSMESSFPQVDIKLKLVKSPKLSKKIQPVVKEISDPYKEQLPLIIKSATALVLGLLAFIAFLLYLFKKSKPLDVDAGTFEKAAPVSDQQRSSFIDSLCSPGVLKKIISNSSGNETQLVAILGRVTPSEIPESILKELTLGEIQIIGRSFDCALGSISDADKLSFLASKLAWSKLENRFSAIKKDKDFEIIQEYFFQSENIQGKAFLMLNLEKNKWEKLLTIVSDSERSLMAEKFYGLKELDSSQMSIIKEKVEKELDVISETYENSQKVNEGIPYLINSFSEANKIDLPISLNDTKIDHMIEKLPDSEILTYALSHDLMDLKFLFSDMNSRNVERIMKLLPERIQFKISSLKLDESKQGLDAKFKFINYIIERNRHETHAHNISTHSF